MTDDIEEKPVVAGRVNGLRPVPERILERLETLAENLEAGEPLPDPLPAPPAHLLLQQELYFDSPY